MHSILASDCAVLVLARNAHYNLMSRNSRDERFCTIASRLWIAVKETFR